MTATLVVILFLAIALEFILSLSWWRPYYRFGIPLFYTRINVGKGFSFSGIPGQSDPAVASLDNFGFTVKQVSSNEVAVRERLFVVSRSATLHGLIRYFPDRNEVIAWGFIDWSLLFFVGGLALMVSRVPSFVWLIVLFIFLSTSINKINQFKKLVGSTTT